ncbi:hypothetical protein [Modestobacter sp. KNN46-3]|uniref:hypothetical protein n=1 Tax=Modestobacter sp. KNN46-3 TaxID=2711218 RepID=UPI0013E01685|nr:hypothetical protein [Modestobacter sp. KNN46-3]
MTRAARRNLDRRRNVIDCPSERHGADQGWGHEWPGKSRPSKGHAHTTARCHQLVQQSRLQAAHDGLVIGVGPTAHVGVGRDPVTEGLVPSEHDGAGHVQVRRHLQGGERAGHIGHHDRILDEHLLGRENLRAGGGWNPPIHRTQTAQGHP